MRPRGDNHESNHESLYDNGRSALDDGPLTPEERAAHEALIRRLRSMELPGAPPGVKERILSDVLKKVEEQGMLVDGVPSQPLELDAKMPDQALREDRALRAQSRRAQGGRTGEEYSLTRRAMESDRTGVELRQRPFELRGSPPSARRSPLAPPRLATVL